MNLRNRTLAIGGIAGLALGLAAAYIVLQRAEAENTLPAVSPSDGFKVGLAILGVLRLISDIGAPEQ
jgi:hypothetical protein